MIKQPALFFCVIVFLFLFHSRILAVQQYEPLFVDNFTSPNDNWEINNLGGNVLIQNGLFLTAGNSRQFPFLILKNNPIPLEGDYYIKVTYEFPQATFFGDGFGIGNVVPNYGSYQEEITNIDSDFIQFHIWRSLTDLHVFQTRHCVTLLLCDLDRTTLFQKSYTDMIHTLELKFVGNNFIVYSDGNEITNSALLNSTRRPTIFWIGNPVMLNSPQDWTSLTIKNVQIGKIVEVSESKTPVIVLPGFGGSWDLSAILSGTPGDNWEVPEQITVYDGLMNSLSDKGYVDGTDLFLFPYDWRKPLDSLADDLNSFIVDNGLSGEKINLVGHSLGGLVARAYAQKYGVDKIEKIITAGSPHFGTVDSYGLWEGAVFWGNVWWEKALLAITSELNQLPGEQKIDTLRRLAPSIKDLLPTNSFIYLNSLLRPWGDLLQKNLYLGNLNTHSDQVDTVLYPLWSDDEQTRSSIKTNPRNRLDSLLGIWEDGRPLKQNPFNLLPGDGTVTQESAVGSFTGNDIEGSGNHISLISSEQNIRKILSELNVDSDLVSGSYVNYPSTVFIAALRSPGRLEVCNLVLEKCNSDLGLYFSEDKLFMLPGYNGEKLRVRVYETGLGDYALHLGSITDTDTWTKIEGSLQRQSQVDTYDVIYGEPYPYNKEHCLKDGWAKYTYVKFKNQGSCVGYVEKQVNDRDN